MPRALLARCRAGPGLAPRLPAADCARARSSATPSDPDARRKSARRAA